MQAIILAAGLGSRLGAMTREVPKALIEVDGRPLIEYTLRFVRAAGATRVIVVGGFHFAELSERVAALDERAVCVDNPGYRQGNLISLQAGLPHRDPDDSYLVTNTDHIYRPSIAEIIAEVATTATDITAFCDFDRRLTADDMKVALTADRRVVKMSKQLPEWDAGYVGMTFVPRARSGCHRHAACAALAAQGNAIHVESILVELAATGRPPRIADISGHGWLEVDEPHERDHADTILRAERWW